MTRGFVRPIPALSAILACIGLGWGTVDDCRGQPFFYNLTSRFELSDAVEVPRRCRYPGPARAGQGLCCRRAVGRSHRNAAPGHGNRLGASDRGQRPPLRQRARVLPHADRGAARGGAGAVSRPGRLAGAAAVRRGNRRARPSAAPSRRRAILCQQFGRRCVASAGRHGARARPTWRSPRLVGKTDRDAPTLRAARRVRAGYG